MIGGAEGLLLSDTAAPGPEPSLPAWFGEFLASGADRPAILKRELQARGVRCRRVELAGGRHILAWPLAGRRDASIRQKIITAHHDRVPGTPGALDNSAAILQLFDFLVDRTRPSAGTTVIFTDREELSGDSVEAQGSWALGRAFASLGLRRPLVFALDVCGRGDTLVLSSAADSLAQAGKPHLGERPVELASELQEVSDALLRLLGPSFPACRARVPFGEDLGFLCAGQAALVLTVLPRAELADLSGFSFTPGVHGNLLPPWASLRSPGMPATWRYLHGERDTPELYTAEAFALMRILLDRLGMWRLPVYLG